MSKDKNIHNRVGQKDFWPNNFIKCVITVLKNEEDNNKIVENKGKTE